MRILKKQGKIANKKSPAGRRGVCITNKIFNDGKDTSKNFLLQEKDKKSTRHRTTSD